MRWPPNTCGFLAVVVCAQGHACTLRARAHGGNHDVMPDGAVVPSIVCPVRGCTDHVIGMLEDWAAELSPSSPPGAPPGGSAPPTP